MQYKFGTSSAVLIHVGTKRVAKEIDKFVTQIPDATQRKNAIFVVGPPKSGKTAEASVVIPNLLEPHIEKVVVKKSQLPCRKVYIDCLELRGGTFTLVLELISCSNYIARKTLEILHNSSRHTWATS